MAALRHSTERCVFFPGVLLLSFYYLSIILILFDDLWNAAVRFQSHNFAHRKGTRDYALLRV